MYNTLKSAGKRILPQKFIRANESLLRKLLSFRYRGNRYTCNICKMNLSRFIPFGKNDLLCPNCGSRCRTRRLLSILNEEIDLKGKVLHFSPSRAMYDLLKADKKITYYPTDFENEFLADYHFDILNIDMPDDYFDIIICYHILEHIEDDLTAMRELKRVLNTSGECLIQTPFKNGEIYEDGTIKTPQGRLKAFGQKDHVRIYSIDGLKERLEQLGFTIEVLSYDIEDEDIYQRGKGISLKATITQKILK